MKISAGLEILTWDIILCRVKFFETWLFNMPQVICQRTFYTASHSFYFRVPLYVYDVWHFITFYAWDILFHMTIQCKTLLINEVPCLRLQASYKHFYKARFYIDNSNNMILQIKWSVKFACSDCYFNWWIRQLKIFSFRQIKNFHKAFGIV